MTLPEARAKGAECHCGLAVDRISRPGDSWRVECLRPLLTRFLLDGFYHVG